MERFRERQMYLPPPRDAANVAAQVATSSLWSGAGVAATTLLQLVRSMIFARLLMPADFGVVNLAGVFTQFVLIFANFGFTASIIYHEDLDKRDLATSWWGNVAVDSAAAMICVVIALISGRVSENPVLLPIVALLAVQFVVTSVGSVNMALMRRSFMYKELAIADFVGAVATFAFGWAFMSLFNWGVYGLVGGMIAGNIVMILMCFAYLPWMPSWHFSFPSLRKHLLYGRWFLGVSVITYANTNIDRVAVGSLLNTTQLGFYEYAGNIPLQVVTKISYVFNSVFFSAFSSLQSSPEGIKELLRKLYRFNALLTFPILTGIALVAPDFVQVAYGDTWMPIVPTIRLFCLYGVLMLYVQPLYSVCNGVGEQQMPFRWTLIYLPVNLLLIYAGVKLGKLDGVVLARSAMPLFTAFTLGIQIMRRVRVPWAVLIQATYPAASASLAMTVVVLGVDRLGTSLALDTLPHLLVGVVAGAVVYTLVLLTFWRSDLASLLRLLRRFG
jgi:O-antigen/teichoic acid export membrane protein